MAIPLYATACPQRTDAAGLFTPQQAVFWKMDLRGLLADALGVIGDATFQGFFYAVVLFSGKAL